MARIATNANLGLKVGDRVELAHNLGIVTTELRKGSRGTVTGFNSQHNKVIVRLDEDSSPLEDSRWPFAREELLPVTDEKPEEPVSTEAPTQDAAPEEKTVEASAPEQPQTPGSGRG